MGVEILSCTTVRTHTDTLPVLGGRTKGYRGWLSVETFVLRQGGKELREIFSFLLGNGSWLTSEEL